MIRYMAYRVPVLFFSWQTVNIVNEMLLQYLLTSIETISISEIDF